MIKRAFKLKSKIDFNRLDINLLQKKIIDLGTFLVMDEDTLALQIITHRAGRKEYIVLIPGKVSFIIINVSERSKDVLLKALEKINKWLKLSNNTLREIKALIDLYLFIDTFNKGEIKARVKELLEKNINYIRQIDPRILKNMLTSIADAVVNVVVEDISSNAEFPKKVLQCFSMSELKEIFKHELMITEAKSYALRILKNSLKEFIH